MEPKKTPHPSCFIDSRYTDIISQYAAKAEKSGRLHPEQLAVIYDQKWFNLFVPEAYGGLQLSLPEALKIEECLAWADGSTGWTVTLCSGANWFVGFLQQDIAAALFKTAHTCFAGSGRPSGRAIIKGDGYEISGYWSYATGTPDATAFTANCIIEKDGKIMQNEDGSPVIKAFIFLREEVTLHETWSSIGMIATASHSFAVDKYVHQNRSFIIDKTRAVLADPIYQYPFLQFAEATLAVNNSGMAIRYFDSCKKLIQERAGNNNYTAEAKDLFKQLLETSINEHNIIRQLFYSTIQRSWEEYMQAKTFLPGTLKEVSDSSRELAATSRKLVDALYPYCGLTAADPVSEINRVWRNMHTSSQHPLLLYSY